MADSYWITFFISHHGDEERRYQALLAAIRPLISGKWWTESVNFLLFDSEHGIDHIADEICRVLDTDTDLALLAATTEQKARVIGTVKEARLYELMPSALPVRAGPVQRPPPASAASEM
jgi:hypothetical protein